MGCVQEEFLAADQLDRARSDEAGSGYPSEPATALAGARGGALYQKVPGSEELSREGSGPRLHRRRDGRVLAGVAGGLADHLDVRVSWVRLTFALLCALGGAGLFAYGLLWMFAPQRAEDNAPDATSGAERQRAFGLLALGIGLAVVGSMITGIIPGWVTAPVALALIGAIVVWREADESRRSRWRAEARTGVAGVVRGRGGWTAAVRIVCGAALVATGIGIVLLRGGSFDQVRFALFAVLATLVGVAVLTVPFWLRLVRDLGEERRTRIRTQERAEIAAHLHDSVLQTLALIQKQSEAPREVAKLARGQERQLRTWLYGPSGYGAGQRGPEVEAGSADLFSATLESACGDVEESFGVTIDQVVVGDTLVDEPIGATVKAAREAMVNAAKHAGVGEISVYAEIEPDKLTVFVRDRGSGFDPEEVPEDRRGLAESVRGRMDRYGGSYTLRAEPGAGTEVVLAMPLRRQKEGAS